MLGCAFAFVDAVGTHGVGDLVEHLALLDKLVDQHLAILVVYVVVACAMNQEQIALQTVCPIDGGAIFVTFGIVLWRVHVAFLIDGVVESLVGHERYGYARLEHFGVTEHTVERLAATTAPACDADAFGVDEGKLTRHVEDALCLVLAGESAHLAIDAFAPFSSTWSCCTTILDAHHNVAEAG